MFDAHCHLDLPAFDDDRRDVLERARHAGVEGVLVAGVGPDGWPRQQALAEDEAMVHVALGIHPWTAAKMSDVELSGAFDSLDEALRKEGQCVPVGLGELGMDRGRRMDPASLPRQERAFRVQLAMAREADLPVVLHLVRCHGAALDVLQGDGLPQAGGMVHAFSGSAEVAQSYVDLGLHISFSTMIARPGTDNLRAAARVVPSERLLVETDSPDQAPRPTEVERNEPANLVLAIRTIAEARGAEERAIAELTTQNARRLFWLA